MQHRGKFLVLLWSAACGDAGSMSTTSVTQTSVATTAGASDASDASDATMSAMSGSTVEPTSAADTTNAPPGTTGAASGGPVFLSFNANVKTITEGESVTFTAILTDPDGVADIVGGSLLSPDEAIEFGPFVAAGQPGTYSIVLSWAAIHQADPINFENGEVSRMFAARFFDQMANKATDITELGLACTGGGACDGACKDLGADGANCGTCGKTCDSGVCLDGACGPTWGPCFGPDDKLETCDAACASIQETCVENGCGMGDTVIWYGGFGECEDKFGREYWEQGCDVPQPWGEQAIEEARCCCSDTK